MQKSFSLVTLLSTITTCISFVVVNDLTATEISEDAVKAERLEWSTDFRKAAKESARTKKPMLLHLTAPWCGFCHKMVKETYSDQRISSHVNKCFIPVSVNVETNERLVGVIGIEGVPTTVVITPDLHIVQKVAGFQTVAELEKNLDKVCTHKDEGKEQVDDAGE